MGLVDEQHHRFDTGLHLVDHRAQALLKLAFHARASLQQADVEGQQLHILEAGRHVATGDALGKPFDHGGLADARLAHQDGVVLAATHEDVDHLANLFIATDDGVHLARTRLFSEVDGKALQGFLRFARGQRAEVFAGRLVAVAGAHPGFGGVLEQRCESLTQVIDTDLVELAGNPIQAVAQAGGFQQRQQ